MNKVIAILKEQEAHYGLNAALKTKRQHEYESAVEEIQLVLQMLQLNKHGVSRSAIADVVLEAEKRVAKCIKDDIDFGYDLKMIRNRIKTGSYVGSSVETYRSYKRHFG